MKHLSIATLTLIVLAGHAAAGPPMICHTYAIGNDTSLPWGTDKNSWSNPDPKYDVANLAADTLKLLDSGKPLLTRMETLRRAAVYSSKNTAAGLELASRLTARALATEVKGQNNSLALFDAGYFVESMKQMSHMSKSNAFSGIDGYDWAKRSLPGLQDRLAAEYALGLMQAETSWPNEHIRRAVAGAREGSLLAENLIKHFQNQSLAAVKQTLAVKSASR
ncbi:MAG: hypothetical protein HYZ57_02685 [Acidobacteria bacterium]|nr:hypothetical protein [Acidobacteriota bacterium]MBI3278729.1 hypothetical protein [Acidobacteriota bacterium]